MDIVEIILREMTKTHIGFIVKNLMKKKTIIVRKKKKIEIKKMIARMMNPVIKKIEMIQRIMMKDQLIIKILNLQISKMNKIVRFNQSKLLKTYLMQLKRMKK